MRIALTALTPQGPRDVVLNADVHASTGQVAAALRETFAPDEHPAPTLVFPQGGGSPAPSDNGEPRTLWLNGKPLDSEAPVAEVLRDGSVVTTDVRVSAATALAEPAGVAELRVIGGPNAGSVYRLGPGTYTIGSAPSCYVELRMPAVPPLAGSLTISRGRDEPVFEPAGQIDGQAAGQRPMLDGKAVGEARPWPFGGVMRIGTAIVALMRPQVPDAILTPADSGGVTYNRPPRLQRPTPALKIEVPAKPKRDWRTTIMLLSVLVPLVIGGVTVYATRQWTFALFILAGPVLLIPQWLISRGEGGPYRKKRRKYRETMASLATRLEEGRAVDEARRREDNMDPAQILLTATGPRRRLWERRADDPDVLRLRVGTFDGPARVQVVKAADAKQDEDIKLPPVPTAFCVPVAIPLARLGVIGLAGPVNASRALARWFVAQAAVMHSPHDLSIVVLTAEPEASRHWSWVRWLPHTAPRGAEECISLVGADPESAARRVSELLAEVSGRLARAADGKGAGFGAGSGLGAGQGADAAQVAGSELGPKILI
ncbi:MAG: FtsK/SpoIIIE domain-containing protein, partial [Trebonia sp.]